MTRSDRRIRAPEPLNMEPPLFAPDFPVSCIDGDNYGENHSIQLVNGGCREPAFSAGTGRFTIGTISLLGRFSGGSEAAPMPRSSTAFNRDSLLQKVAISTTGPPVQDRTLHS